jgi:putative hydrolase of the HAD superfamily
MMDDLGLGTIFDCHFASHLTGRIKPDEGAFLHVVAALGCKASEVLFLDDNKMNVEVAKTVGMEAERVRGVVEAEGALSRRGIISGSLT